jgi:hypothetical protein
MGNAVGAGCITAGKLHASEMNSQVNSKSRADLRKAKFIVICGGLYIRVEQITHQSCQQGYQQA